MEENLKRVEETSKLLEEDSEHTLFLPLLFLLSFYREDLSKTIVHEAGKEVLLPPELLKIYLALTMKELQEIEKSLRNRLIQNRG